MTGAADHLLLWALFLLRLPTTVWEDSDGTWLTPGGAVSGGMGDSLLRVGSLPLRTCRGGSVLLSSSLVTSMSVRVNGENWCSASLGETQEGWLVTFAADNS